MGVLNCTPDSFSDGGLYLTHAAAMQQAERMVLAGAKIIDVGGESTRPGANAEAVSTEEELRRVIPVIRDIKKQFDVKVSVDTSRAEVMQAAADVGVDLINDVRAFRDPAAFKVALKLNIPLCIMHMQGEPKHMQAAPHYDDVLSEVKAFLSERVLAFRNAGFTQTIVIDPGFGFGKTLLDNLNLLLGLSTFKSLGSPILVGVSRKTMIGQITGRPVEERLAGSLAAATLAMWQGADIIRVHDVAETLDAMKVVCAVKDLKHD